MIGRTLQLLAKTDDALDLLITESAMGDLALLVRQFGIAGHLYEIRDYRKSIVLFWRSARFHHRPLRSLVNVLKALVMSIVSGEARRIAPRRSDLSAFLWQKPTHKDGSLRNNQKTWPNDLI